MTLRCPGCGAGPLRPVGRLPLAPLLQAWRRPPFQVDVAGLFPAGCRELRHWRCAVCDLQGFDPAPAGDEAFYTALQKQAWYYQDDKPEHHQLARLLAGQAAGTVLEPGCGAGHLARHLPPGWRYRGLEPNPAGRARARASGLDVGAHDLADETGQYEVVCHFQVLEHVSDPLGFLQQGVARLAPGGLMAVAVPADDAWPGVAPGAWLNLPPHHLTRWSDRALTLALERVGLRVEGLWHEPLAAVHQADHADAMAHWAWQSLWGPAAGGGPAGRGPLQRLAWKWPGLRQALARRGCRRHPGAGRGHTVMAWGRRLQ